VEEKRVFTRLCWFQGGYYLVTGAWPVVSMRSFELVTGEKTDNLPTGLEADHWLVMTVAGLILAVAAALLTAAIRKSVVFEIGVLALGAALALASIDLIYTFRGVISPIYLADAALEIPMILLWSAILLKIARRRPAPIETKRTDYMRVGAA
jgi:hypothetical protein